MAKRLLAVTLAMILLLMNCSAVFAAGEVPITVKVEDTGRTLEPPGEKGAYVERTSDVTPGGTVTIRLNGAEVTSAPAGAEVTVSATPRLGYKFAGWQSNGAVAQADAATTTLTVPESDAELTAIFEIDFDYFTERNAELPINELSNGGPMGTHVLPDPDSPTGYTVFVIYKNHNHLEANSARNPEDRLELIDPDSIWRVRFWSNTMILIDPSAESMNANTVVQPEDFRPGLVAGGGNSYGVPRDMLNVPGTDMWYVSIPAMSGAFVYSLYINDDARPNWDAVTYQVDGTVSHAEPNTTQAMTRLDNPYDPTMVNEANGTRSLSSMIYVPYDEKMDHEWVDGEWVKVTHGNKTPAAHERMEDQGSWINRDVLLPRNGVNGAPDDGQTGIMVFHEYEVEYEVDAMNRQTGEMTETFSAPTAIAGGGVTTPGIYARDRLRTEDGNDARAISVYLPYGYDADREEPYNVLYFIMGTTSDNVGNDMRWFHEGAAQHMFDNLFADYGVEPFIAVGVDWQNLRWDVSRSSHDLTEYLLPFMEANYNVSTDRQGRGVIGMSAGGGASSNMYWHNLDIFGNLGMLSAGGNVAFDWLINQTGTVREGLQTGGLAIGDVFTGNHQAGSGMWDSIAASANYIDTINENNLNASGELKALRVPGNHDWNAYQLLLFDWATGNLFREFDTESNQSPVRMTTDAHNVKKGETFKLETTFKEEQESNTAILNYTWDGDLFKFAYFYKADGVTLVDHQYGDGWAKITLMAPDYDLEALGTLDLTAKEDAPLVRGWETVKLDIEYVLRDESGNKSIMNATASARFTTVGNGPNPEPYLPGDTNDDGVVDIMDLSNMIDWFGYTSENQSDWDDWYTYFDFNNDGEIDISDIAHVAKLI